MENETRLSARIGALEAELRKERENAAEKLALLESASQALVNQFQALAGEILDAKAKTFAEGSQKELGNLLAPLQTQLKEFREKVEQAQGDSKTGVTRLETLIGTLGTLNQQLTEEARNLSTALRGSAKTQGDWGEFIFATCWTRPACAKARSTNSSSPSRRRPKAVSGRGRCART